jgi:hypothetical protein
VIPISIYDATLMLVTPTGKPIVGASVKLGTKALGLTGAAGDVLAPLVPAGSFPVNATWYGRDISPTANLAIKGTRTYLVTASKVYTLQVRVVGAQEQGLTGAHVDVKLGGSSIYSGVTDADGVVTLELPSATYSVSATY